MRNFQGKAGLVQRVLPNYRAPFFNALGEVCINGLGVFYGAPRPAEMIKSVRNLENAVLTKGKNLHIFTGTFYLCLQIGLINWLKDWEPDILILEANPRYLRTPAAVRWMHQRNRPVIGWGLGAPLLSGPFAGLRQKRRRHFVNQFDALITYSQTGAAEYAQLGVPEDQIFIAVNAVTPVPAQPLTHRSPANQGEALTALFVGRLQERKRVDHLIKACAQLPPSHQPELVIVGDGPAAESLQSLASAHYPRTRFTGALYGEALADQFRAADIFVLPGTGGLAVQQAMSYGLPVIAAEADGTQADLVRPENGWQIPPDDLPALIAALEKALSDVSRLRQMGENSYRIVAEEINLEQMVKVFLDVMNRCSA
jgi:glycosyltransferase involved in cell wall biosynthesis